MALTTVSSDRLSTNVKTSNLGTELKKKVGQNKNIIINGAMQVAQRGTSSTTSGYGSVDRWQGQHANTGVTVTHSQQTLSSSDTPYQSGFGKFFRLALSGAGTANANAYLEMQYRTESQDMLNSGWNYKSSSSFITMSFWFRCSTNQTFLARVFNHDSLRGYDFSFTASGNNAWTKITKTIPGNSNLVFNDDTGIGLRIHITPVYGTDYTNNLALDQCITGDPNNQFPDMASTWLTAGASTFDITGVQLEVGSVATDFEHLSFGEDLHKCQRYYARFGANAGGAGLNFSQGELYGQGLVDNDGTICEIQIRFPRTLRAEPTAVEQFGSADRYQVRRDTTLTCTSVPTFNSATVYSASIGFHKSSHGWSTGQVANGLSAGSDSFLGFSAEL